MRLSRARFLSLARTTNQGTKPMSEGANISSRARE
jgi:hypothetical protein